MVSVMLAIASTERSIVLVDEIENGVFHTHHEALWRAILALARNYKGQIFATTHSYEWLEALVQAAGDKLDDIALWRLERSDNGEPVLFQFEGDTLKGAIKHGAEARGG
jgi:AAA15 family ATPase/GTPase